MEMTARICLLEGNHVRLRCALETGIIKAITGEFVYILMDNTNERRLFATYVDGKATIEIVSGEDRADGHTLIPCPE
jgi:hypothetical protein